MTWFNLVKWFHEDHDEEEMDRIYQESFGRSRGADSNTRLLIRSKHRYGPIDAWHDCNECLQEWNEFEAKMEGRGLTPKEIKSQKKHFVDVRGSTRNRQGKKRWIWVKDSELEEHVDKDSYTYKKFRGLI